MFNGADQLGEDGITHKPDARVLISPQEGMWLYNHCRRVKPQRTLEIGLAYGFSTCFLLAAHHANGTGPHVAVDPYQSVRWHGVGVQKAKSLSMERQFQWIGDISAVAVPALFKDGVTFETIFIDGDHRFDSVMLDFKLCDLVCADGGYIVLDDMWMPSVRRVVAFVERNRANYRREPTPLKSIAAFQKLGPDERPWDHFRRF
jgi:predicted O-methyltransferase YrrM